MTSARPLLVGLASLLVPRLASASSCLDGTVCTAEWTPGDGGPLFGEQAHSDMVICVLAANTSYPSGQNLDMPEGIRTLRFCAADSGEGDDASRPVIPPISLTLLPEDDESTAPVALTIDGMDIAEVNGLPALNLRGASSSVVVSDVTYEGSSSFLQLSSDMAAVDVEFKRTTAGVGPAVKSCAGVTRVTLTTVDDGEPAPFSFESSDSRTRPLFYKHCSTGSGSPNAALELYGVLHVDGQAPLTGGEDGDEDDMFDTVMLEALSVEGEIGCDPCVRAVSSISAVDTSWSVDETSPAGTWLRSDSGAVSIIDSDFETPGEPWTLARARVVRTLRLDACMSGAPEDESSALPMFALEADGDLLLWNSVVRHMKGDSALVEFRDGTDARARLRGVTVQTGNSNGTLISDWDRVDIINTLLIQSGDGTGGPVPGDLELAENVLLTDPASLFVQPDDTAGRCDARLIPDRAQTGTRGKGATKIVYDESEVSIGVLALGELESLETGLDSEEPWCDPDATWPDIGAWSGPLSSALYAPGASSSARACPSIGDDSGMGADTGEPPGIEIDDFVWGSGCRCSDAGGTGALSLLLIPLWWRRRLRTPGSTAP